MKGYSIQQSIAAAIRGVAYAFKNERNFRIEIFFAFFVLCALCIVHASLMQIAMVVIMIFLVLMIELMNTVIERVVDILKPRNHPYAGVIKDISASMVLVLSVGASIVGLIIFIPLFIQLLN